MKTFDGTKERKTRERPNQLENIKGTFFLQKMFDNILKNKYLGIIKYNKNFQKRMNLNINDYKEYSEKYTPIELEIIPTKERIQKFINVKKGDLDYSQVVKDTIKEDEKYFHIYFNDNKEEIKRQYLIKDDPDKVKKIKIIIDYQVLSFEKLFYDCSCIESICFKKFYRNNINNMNNMFSLCKNLKEIKFSSFNTDNVTDMSCMFFCCETLEKLDLSNFNTINVIKMLRMFFGCKTLKKLDVSSFNTNNVINMMNMFTSCSSLKELNLSNFNTNKVDDMEGMFYKCSSLEELDISNFNFDNVTKMKGMFWGCRNDLQTRIKEQYNKIKEEAFKNICVIF